MDVDKAAARQAINQSILVVELAKGKTRAPNNDLPVSYRIVPKASRLASARPLPDRHVRDHRGHVLDPTLESWLTRQFDPQSDAGMAYRDLLLATLEAEHEIATCVFAPTRFDGLDDFNSELVAYFYINAHSHGLVMRHCTKLYISHRDFLMPKSNAELAQLIRRTFDVIPAEQRYSEYTMVGVILAAIPDSAVNALEAAARHANEQFDTYETVLRHLEAAVDIEHNGGNKRPSPADPETDPPNKYIRPGASPFSAGTAPTPSPRPPPTVKTAGIDKLSIDRK
eukprot:jgi/Tetstr1/449802/TSEL_036866.t1